MCGRYVLKREDLEWMAKHLGLRSLEEYHSRYNIAPTSVVPVIRQTKAAAPELAAVRWGLIPAWAKPDAPLKPLVNVRSETAVARFRGALKTRRCVLPAAGFYEWETLGTKKQPWFFALRDGEPFGLAGFWDCWRGEAGVELETCTILTTAANEVLAPIHDRMPVMLTPDQCRTWVDGAVAELSVIERLLGPFRAESMTAVKVGPAVSSVKNDGPECLLPASAEPSGDSGPQLSLGL